MPPRACYLVLIFVAWIAPQPATGQEPIDGTVLSVNGMELTVGGRVQTQFNTTDVDSEPPSELDFRRVWLEVGLQVNERVSGAVQADFAGNEVVIRDAYLNLELRPAFQLLAGQTYRPFGLLEQTSTKRILPIERGLRIRGLDAADESALLDGLRYSSRDIGIQLHGEPVDAPLGFSYRVGVLRGPLQGQVGNQDSYQFAGRAVIAPIEGIRVGAGWSNRDFLRVVEPDSAIDLERGNAFEIDFEYGDFAPGPHVMAEVATGVYDPFENVDFWGAHTWLAYRTEPVTGFDLMLEPIFRVSHSDITDPAPPGTVEAGTLFTPGVTVYFTPLNRIMLNYDFWIAANNGTDANSLKAMFQFAF